MSMPNPLSLGHERYEHERYEHERIVTHDSTIQRHMPTHETAQLRLTQ